MKITYLPAEIISQIVSCVGGSKDLLSCALSNRLFLSHAVSQLWSTVSLVFADGSERRAKVILNLLQGKSELRENYEGHSRLMKRKYSSVVAEQESFVLPLKRLKINEVPQEQQRERANAPLSAPKRKEVDPAFFEYGAFVKNLKLSGNANNCSFSTLREFEQSLPYLACLKYLSLENFSYNNLHFLNVLVKATAATLSSLDVTHSNFVCAQSIKSLEGLKKLSCLHVTSSALITDETLKFIAGSDSFKLTELSLINCPCISDDGVSFLGLKLNGLEMLALSYCNNVSPVGALQLIKDNQNLDILLLDGQETLSDAQMSSIVSSCPQLKLISLEKCRNLTDKSVAHIAQKCLGIGSLNLTFTNLSDAGIDALCKSKLKNLFELFMGKCLRVSLNAFNRLFKAYPNLLHIYLAGCSQVDDNCIITLIKHCTKLEILSIPGTSITDTALFEACQLSKTLKVAQFSFCNEITPNSVGHLAFTCQKLTILQLVGCAKIRNSFIQPYSKPCPPRLQNRYGNGAYCALRPPNISSMGQHWHQTWNF